MAGKWSVRFHWGVRMPISVSQHRAGADQLITCAAILGAAVMLPAVG
jgi:hypothetical protein